MGDPVGRRVNFMTPGTESDSEKKDLGDQPDLTAYFLDPPSREDKRRPGYYWPFAVSLVVLAFDQLTKRLVEDNLGPLGSGKSYEWLGGQLRVVYIVNKGASFGFLNNGEASWIFTLLAIAATLGIVGWYVVSGTRNRWLQLGLGLVLGGIVGNLLDRLLQGGGVTDIITLPNLGLFKVFNIADSGITVGVVVVILTIVLQGLAQGREASVRGGGAKTGTERVDQEEI